VPYIYRVHPRWAFAFDFLPFLFYQPPKALHFSPLFLKEEPGCLVLPLSLVQQDWVVVRSNSCQTGECASWEFSFPIFGGQNSVYITSLKAPIILLSARPPPHCFYHSPFQSCCSRPL
jgi:hypothetical protein